MRINHSAPPPVMSVNGSIGMARNLHLMEELVLAAPKWKWNRRQTSEIDLPVFKGATSAYRCSMRKYLRVCADDGHAPFFRKWRHHASAPISGFTRPRRAVASKTWGLSCCIYFGEAGDMKCSTCTQALSHPLSIVSGSALSHQHAILRNLARGSSGIRSAAITSMHHLSWRNRRVTWRLIIYIFKWLIYLLFLWWPSIFSHFLSIASFAP